MSRITALLAIAVILPVVACELVAQPPANKSPFEKWEKDISAFEADDAKSPKAKGQILFIGSSSIKRWKLNDSFPELDALNRGFGGSQVADSVHFFDRAVKPYQPRQIVMYAGDNDLAKGKSPQQIADDFEEFLSKAEESLPGTRVTFIAVKPSLKRWNLINKVRETNSIIRAMADENEHLTFVDVDAPMIGTDGTPRDELFADDGLHLSEAGYELWTELLTPHLVAGKGQSR
ncbi:GDSL-like Lipase/Acylhydrolase [Thalassoglobus neptunius]|uniref:GDSL-like Lipase/Acylhydrolase n=1 Tax=Thalassoglobus neptunius TaxID=1938619 RepID=A0A5C5X6K2_9PLAN|nr:SGNH/GDSL hydrolase family protein [Thalassoglobus neptunius]TWT57893.1 GDSL-like Lipase/Acylhydrolase [Thalassoglobus neptunius]